MSTPNHHANGRAERAGQQIMEILRKLNTDQKMNWVEGLPRVLRIIHDTPGDAGLTPSEIGFGRERFLANVFYNLHGFVKMLRNVLSAWITWTSMWRTF